MQGSFDQHHIGEEEKYKVEEIISHEGEWTCRITAEEMDEVVTFGQDEEKERKITCISSKVLVLPLSWLELWLNGLGPNVENKDFEILK